jgi:IclR family transcriptional regulator, acetate operon repressor
LRIASNEAVTLAVAFGDRDALSGVIRSDTMDEPKRATGTALIKKACDILDLIGSNPGHADHAMLARHTQIPRATLYRILAALSSRSLIRNDPVTRSFMLGFRFLELAQNVWSSADLVAIASTELRRLRDLTGETSYLAIRQDNQMLALGWFEGAHSRRSSAGLGALKPMHCTSQGKSVLAHLSDQQVDAILSHGMEAMTAKTIVEPDRLKSQLAIIRARGFAIDDEEILEGTRCAGAAVLDDRGRPIAAISVAGPAYRITLERAEQLGQELADAARRIASQFRPLVASSARGDAQAASEFDSSAFFGGDPVWNEASQRLLWTDRLAPALHGWRSDGAAFSLESLGTELDCSFHTGKGAVLICRDRLALVSPTGKITERPRAGWDPITALAVAPSGEVWAASLGENGATSRIGRLADDGDVAQSFSMNGRIDGLAFSPNGGTLYSASSDGGGIHALAIQEKRKRLFSDIPKAAGRPAALAVDVSGRLWVTLIDGWSVVRLDDHGEFERTLAIPVPRPTGLAFGGRNLDRLYVTSARAGLGSETLLNAPMSGRLLTVEPGVSGAAVPLASFSWS